MPNIDKHDPGSFCWFELATTDQQAAKKFYPSLFSWGVQDSPIGPDDMYSMFKLDGRDVGAAYTMRPEQRAQRVPPNWMLYISVADADVAATNAASLGGTVILPPFDVFDFGRMAVIQDPTGAVFSIWQPKKHKGTTIAGENGTACWADLSTADRDRAAKFYAGLFGWKIVGSKEMLPPSPSEYYHIVNGVDFIGGMPPPEHRNPHAPAHWLTYFLVSDCDAATAKVRSLGGRVYMEPMTLEDVGRWSVVADPQGAVFALFQDTKR